MFDLTTSTTAFLSSSVLAKRQKWHQRVETQQPTTKQTENKKTRKSATFVKDEIARTHWSRLG